jgi:phage terminase large subunit-like protein
VVFRYSNGKKGRHTFKADETIASLYDYVWMNKNPNEKFYLVDMGSKNRLEDLDIPLISIEDPEDHSVLINVIDV